MGQSVSATLLNRIMDRGILEWVSVHLGGRAKVWGMEAGKQGEVSSQGGLKKKKNNAFKSPKQLSG